MRFSQGVASALFLLLAVFVTSICYAGPSVTNVQAYQQQNLTRWVKITYKLTSTSSEKVYVTVAISTDNGATYTITPSMATGDIGWVRPGGLRTITWDAKSQYPTARWENCKAKVTVDDSTNSVYPGEMICIPAGTFLMGKNEYETWPLNSSELPQHSVYLSGYYIGKFAVTRGEYRAFMDAGGYANPVYWSNEGWVWKITRQRYQPDCWTATQDWGTGSFNQTDNHPVVGVSYYEAEAFCKWAGGHLPTEAQREKASRWTGSYPNVYPWGNFEDWEKCNNIYDHNEAGGGYNKYQTAPVGSYPSGASPYGCQDMSGNVFEWSKDWYSSDYYSQTPIGGWNDPQGPTNGVEHSLRGGHWGYYYYGFIVARCAYRQGTNPEQGYNCVGFRLAR